MATTPLKSLLKNKDSILVSADDDLFHDINKLEKGLRDKLLAILKKMDTKGGKFIESAYNKQLLISLEKEVRAYMASAKFASPMENYIQLFNDLDKVNAQIFTSVTGKFKEKAAKSLIGAIRAGLVDTVAENLTNTELITANVLPIIKRIAYKNILLGTTFQQAEDEFISLLPKDGSAGIIQRYTTQIVRDTINQYDGAVQKKVSDEIGLNAFMFVGSIIENSRPGCIHMVNAPNAVEICKGKGKNRTCQIHANRFAEIVLPGGGFRNEDIPIIISKNRNDSGWIPDTSPDTYFANRNGYNCRHHTVPFFAVDSEKISKAMN